MSINGIIKERKHVTFEERKKQIEKHKKLAIKSQEAIDSHEFVVTKRKLIVKHNTAIKELLNDCTHDETILKSEDFPGSYYDKSYTEYWNECILCGAKSEKRSEIGWYE